MTKRAPPTYKESLYNGSGKPWTVRECYGRKWKMWV